MNRDKKTIRLAKKLVELSRENGVVSDARVTEVLTALRSGNLRCRLTVLKTYLHFIRKAVAEQTAIVATPGSLSPDALAAIESSFSQLYGRSISAVVAPDSSLIAGLRVRVGDDVYDASVAGRLRRLAENVH